MQMKRRRCSSLSQGHERDAFLEFESIWLEVRNRKDVMTLFGIYYRPQNSREEVKESICRQIMETCRTSRVVIVGDFNYPKVDWEKWGTEGEKFLQCVQENFLEQYFSSPTIEEAVLNLVQGNEEAR